MYFKIINESEFAAYLSLITVNIKFGLKNEIKESSLRRYDDVYKLQGSSLTCLHVTVTLWYCCFRDISAHLLSMTISGQFQCNDRVFNIPVTKSQRVNMPMFFICFQEVAQFKEVEGNAIKLANKLGAEFWALSSLTSKTYNVITPKMRLMIVY